MVARVSEYGQLVGVNLVINLYITPGPRRTQRARTVTARAAARSTRPAVAGVPAVAQGASAAADAAAAGPRGVLRQGWKGERRRRGARRDPRAERAVRQ